MYAGRAMNEREAASRGVSSLSSPLSSSFPGNAVNAQPMYIRLLGKYIRGMDQEMKIVTPCEKILRRFPPKTRTRQKEATSPSAWPKFPRLYLMVMILINSPVALYSTVGVVLDRERREKIIPDFPLCLRRRRRLPLLLRLWRIKGSPAPSIPFLGTARPSVLFAPPFPSHTRLRSSYLSVFIT